LKSQNLLDNQQWQEAIERAQPLLNSPPFKNKANGIIQEAGVNIDSFDRPNIVSEPQSTTNSGEDSTGQRNNFGKTKTQ
ncbi:MAG: hypothetical protein F6K09_33290, partial [Merismopedia sp. SIO2A8]|nr:hypothetical protein [Merismopedia sp. SIO2A8]